MTEYISVNIILVGVLAYMFFKKSKEYVNEKKLKDVVAWCVTTNSNTFRYNFDLWEYLSKAQTQLKLLYEYRISTDEEWTLAKVIIENFQKDITQQYFLNKISIPTSKYVISNEIYFMYLLQEYCKNHQCDYKFLNYNMHEETIARKDYGSWGVQHYDATYRLTEFAVVLHKLYYISYMCCKNSSISNSNAEYWNKEHSIEDIIDSRIISISSM